MKKIIFTFLLAFTINYGFSQGSNSSQGNSPSYLNYKFSISPRYFRDTVKYKHASDQKWVRDSVFKHRITGYIIRQNADSFFVFTTRRDTVCLVVHRIKKKACTKPFCKDPLKRWDASFDYKGFYLVAISIPFALDSKGFNFGHIQKAFEGSTFDANFLNAGIGSVFKFGRLHYNQLWNPYYSPNSTEFGVILPLVGLASISLNQFNLNPADTAKGLLVKYSYFNIPIAQIGGGLYFSTHTIAIILTTGVEYALGGESSLYKYQGQLWVGAGAAINICPIIQIVQRLKFPKKWNVQ